MIAAAVVESRIWLCSLQPIFPPLPPKQPEYLPLCPAGFVLNKSQKLSLERDPKWEVSWELSLSAGMSMSPHEIMPARSCLTLCSSSQGVLNAPTAGAQCALLRILCDHAAGIPWETQLEQHLVLRCDHKSKLCSPVPCGPK